MNVLKTARGLKKQGLIAWGKTGGQGPRGQNVQSIYYAWCLL